MAFVDEATAALYREAWEAWSKQIEARAKDNYDAARLRLLGLEEATPSLADPDANPFR